VDVDAAIGPVPAEAIAAVGTNRAAIIRYGTKKLFRLCLSARMYCILMNMEDLFDSQTLWVIQPGHLPASRARYQIFDNHRELLAEAADNQRRSVLSGPGKSMPHANVLEIINVTGEALLTMVMLHSEWTTEFRDPDGALVGTIEMGDTRRQYRILDESGQRMAQVIGDLGLKNFQIVNGERSKIATVRKTRAGILKEMLTANDHYKLEFIGPVAAHPLRLLIVMVPLVVDLIVYEPLS
jgi:hypothetical protein